MKVAKDLRPDEEAKAAKAVAAVVKTRKDSTLTRATDVIMENEGWRPMWMDVKPIDNEALILKDIEKTCRHTFAVSAVCCLCAFLKLAGLEMF